MLLTKEVEVNVSGKNQKYYKDLGYNIPTYIDKRGRVKVKQNTNIKIKTEDLPSASNIKIDVLCDDCKKSQSSVVYNDYIRRGYNNYFRCKSCSRKLYLHDKYNLKGQKFGKLFVVDKSCAKQNKQYWNCVCDCGNKLVVPTDRLIGGQTKSCGCLKKEIISERMTVWDYNSIKEYIELNSNCLLITSFDILNNLKDKISIYDIKLTIQCECGNLYKTTFNHFKNQNKIQCNNCGVLKRVNKRKLDLDFIYTKFLENNMLITKNEINKYKNNSTKFTAYTQDGYKLHISYVMLINNLDYKRHIFHISNKYNIENMKKWISINRIGYKLITKSYTTNYQKLLWVCPEGHEFEMTWQSFFHQRSNCPECNRLELIEKMKSLPMEKRPNWKGGRSSIYSYLRQNIKDWKIKSMQKSNYKCEITGNKFDIIHHLYSFNLILQEVLDNVNIPLRLNINEYSKKDLKLLKDMCIKLHKKYPLGVCLSDNIHNLFHHIYGTGDNTPEQWHDFKQRYYNGEFNDYIAQQEQNLITQ